MYYPKLTKKYLSSRPLLITSNSSWYLNHYRKLLIQKLKLKKKYVIAMSPVDKSSVELSEQILHIPLRISRKNNFNLIYLFFSLIKMTLLVRAIKPRLIHSHTIKANLISSIIASFYGIPCILSFTGMGNLSKKSGLKKILFILALKLISFSSNLQRESTFRFKKNNKRTIYIFQNPRDIKNFGMIFSTKNFNKNRLIIGSGVPSEYFKLSIKSSWEDRLEGDIKYDPRIVFIYCGRLLRSKGINLFLDLSKKLKEFEFHVYGGIDLSNNDSLKDFELKEYSKKLKNLKFMGNIINPLLKQKNSFPVLIIPSNYGEGLPRTIVEALALKIPVISSQNATCDVFTEDNVYISNDQTANEYLNCIEKIRNDFKSGQLSSKLNNGYQFARNILSEEVVVEETLKVYEEIESYSLIK